MKVTSRINGSARPGPQQLTMINIKVLQININRSRPAHDLALETAQRMGAGIIVLSEPNKNAIRNRKDWIHDSDLNTAIKITDTRIAVQSQGYGTGYTYVETKNLTIYSCYSSGNDELDNLETTLSEIASLITSKHKRAIIAGDFNAKSPQWGMPFTDKRGQIMTEWIASMDLEILNRGDKPTFSRQDYGSILDLTIATANLTQHITQWMVTDDESLSDHNYIAFEFSCNRYSHGTREGRIGKSWNVKKLDKRKLEEAAEQLIESHNIAATSDFSEKLEHLCDKSMPRKKTPRSRQPVHWWNNELTELRRKSVMKRRQYTRLGRRKNARLEQELWTDYQNSRKELRNAIKKAKRDHWKKVRDEVDSDIWGNGYKIVMRGLLGFPPRITMTLETMRKTANHLFPTHSPVTFECDANAQFTNFTLNELKIACGRLKTNKAPGPGSIPAEVLKCLAETKSDYVLSVYNELAQQSLFPLKWKKAKLLLLRKGDKPLENPESYRPICLLDVEGKLYEHLLLGRLKEEISRSGGLSDRQYGFRTGRQTVDAINRVRMIAASAENYAHGNRRLCAMVTIDVRNAFNSASWQLILERLRSGGIDEGLIRIIASYLSDRQILLETDGEKQAICISSGVPQGSVLGPTLWNILYDDLLRMEMPGKTELVGFADDVAMVVTARDEETLMATVNAGLQRVSNWMDKRHLALAPEKTEAVLLTKKRKINPISFNIQGVMINLSGAVKYLGVWLDTKLTFAEHIKRSVVKAEKTIAALSCLMPNVGGPRSSKRLLYSSVIHSQILYGSPAWHDATSNKKLMSKLKSVQRKLAIRVVSAYRTISTDGVGVIAGIPPIDLQILERREKYIGATTSDARQALINKWQARWNQSTKGRWTHSLIPNIETWISQRKGEVDYYVTQALSGHGCFRKYLFERSRSDTSRCIYCEMEDDVEHTLFICARWENERNYFTLRSDRIFSQANMMSCLQESEDTWNHAYSTIRAIIETKERESRLTREQL